MTRSPFEHWLSEINMAWKSSYGPVVFFGKLDAILECC